MNNKNNSSMNEAMNRRRFLRFSGTCALAVLAGAACTRLDSGETAGAVTTCPYALTNDPYPGQCSNYVDSNGSGYCDFSENLSAQSSADNANTTADQTQATATQEPTAQPTQAATATAQAEPSAPQSSELVVLCHRGCSAPGHCRRFRDNDGSGICDLSEGIDPSEL
jgi:hypothetical protein